MLGSKSSNDSSKYHRTTTAFLNRQPLLNCVPVKQHFNVSGLLYVFSCLQAAVWTPRCAH